MAKYNFTAEQRQAVFTVHGEKCYINGELLTMSTVEVDHVVPESLADHPDEFARVRTALGLRDDFDVNSYENWMPACRRCNGLKGDLIWWPSLLVQVCLQRAATRADKAREIAARFRSDKSLANAVAVLQGVAERGELSDDVKAALLPLAQALVEERSEESAGDDVRVTPDFIVPLYEILADDGRITVAKGPFGVGGGPSGEPAPGMRCGVCGLPYFSGARCVTCGTMSDD